MTDKARPTVPLEKVNLGIISSFARGLNTRI
jgi:hypothetical protein